MDFPAPPFPATRTPRALAACLARARRAVVLALFFALAAPALSLSAGCAAKESHRAVQSATVATRGTTYTGRKHRLALGNFENKSPYLRGLFTDGPDRLGLQAQQILKTHLSQTNRFVLVDRANMAELEREARIANRPQKLTAGEVVLTGAVTEFGRRETGTHALGGVFGRSKKQAAYAKVAVSVVDVNTSQVLYSAQGAGEYDLSNEEVLGFGTSAGYDATLNDKVLNLAMIEVVNQLVDGMERGEWSAPAE